MKNVRMNKTNQNKVLKMKPLALRGRPPKFTTPDQVFKIAETYFGACIKKNEPYTVTGLAMALGTTRKTLVEYEKKGNELSDAIKRCKTVIENFYECRLSFPNPAGAIFALKNFGWTDRMDLVSEGKATNIGKVVILPAKSEPR